MLVMENLWCLIYFFLIKRKKCRLTFGTASVRDVLMKIEKIDTIKKPVLGRRV